MPYRTENGTHSFPKCARHTSDTAPAMTFDVAASVPSEDINRPMLDLSTALTPNLPVPESRFRTTGTLA